MRHVAVEFDRFVAHGAGRSRRAVLGGIGGTGLAAALLRGIPRPAAHGTDEVARAAMDALNQALAGDASKLDAVFAADVTVQPRRRLLATGARASPGLAGLKAALADIRHAVPNCTPVVNDLIAAEEKVAGRFSFLGTLGTASPPLAGNGLVFFVVRDDRVAALWLYPDPYALMAVMALGGMATPPPSRPIAALPVPVLRFCHRAAGHAHARETAKALA